MRGEHVNIEVANTMLGPSSYFHVRVFSLSFHTSMMTYVTDIASELLPCKSSRGGSVHFLVRRPSFTFSPEIGRKRLPCKPAGFSILTSTVKGRGVVPSWLILDKPSFRQRGRQTPKALQRPEAHACRSSGRCPKSWSVRRAEFEDSEVQWSHDFAAQ